MYFKDNNIYIFKCIYFASRPENFNSHPCKDNFHAYLHRRMNAALPNIKNMYWIIFVLQKHWWNIVYGCVSVFVLIARLLKLYIKPRRAKKKKYLWEQPTLRGVHAMVVVISIWKRNKWFKMV